MLIESAGVPHSSENLPTGVIRVRVVFGAAQRLEGACAVLAHLARQRHWVAVYCPDAEQFDRLDRLLWEYDSSNFVPHVDADDPLLACTPIGLYRQPPPPDTPCVLNLADAALPLPLTYPDVLEIVSADPAERARGRAHWRYYQAAACELQAFDLNRNQLP